MTVQILDISGCKMAVLPMADYERLLDMVEDRADAATAALAHQRLLDGEEIFPAEFVNILSSGENRLRTWRKLATVFPTDVDDIMPFNDLHKVANAS